MPRHVNKDGGFIPNVQIKGYKNSKYLIANIVHEQKLSTKEVENMLRYNIITVRNLAIVTGLTQNNISMKVRGRVVGNDQIRYFLNTCDPFNDPFLKFIYRNAKCQDLIEKCAGLNRESNAIINPENDLKDER
jgi:hypothetical protein